MTDPTDLLRAEPIKMAAPQKRERTIFTAAPAGPEDGMEFVVIIDLYTHNPRLTPILPLELSPSHSL